MSSNGFRFHVGISLASGLIWTSVAPGGDPLFPSAQYPAGDMATCVAIGV